MNKYEFLANIRLILTKTNSVFVDADDLLDEVYDGGGLDRDRSMVRAAQVLRVYLQNAVILCEEVLKEEEGIQ